MAQRIWVTLSKDEEAVLTDVAERMGGSLRSLIIEAALAAARGDMVAEARALLAERVLDRDAIRHCRSGSDTTSEEQRRAVLETVGPEPAVGEPDRRPHRPPAAQPMCEEATRALRDLLKRAAQQAEMRRCDGHTRDQSGDSWRES